MTETETGWALALWMPILRGKRVTAWQECFKASGEWMSIPGVSRWISVSA